MKNSFNFTRFMNVARWDLTINRKFYTRAATLMVALACMPVVLFYLYGMLSDKFFFTRYLYDNAEGLSLIIALIGCAYCVISSGYMFHNLLTKQGRINELTLPATNLERFLWHFVVIVIGVNLVYFVGVVCADLLHAIFRLMIPGADIKSITYENIAGCYNNWPEMGEHTFGISLFLILLIFSYVRFFCLVNAWKYHYNIPLTFLFYFIFQNVFGLLVLFIGIQFPEVVRWLFNNLVNILPWTYGLVCINLFAASLYIGIWLLTYRLYKRAQLTTRRNP